ncbi:DUF4251 domain-containing protein [Galbibacter pacificus]|uniref:DUF4251 domain-containing protein n=1 Tax=Galbibacter pacificus TaxID=2996052 RepID=A0ABT6FRC8_9FLAO|nr:DUF4251 domain-containing protein [Galbibacter pacificus]MDG3581701.1 DUF4251 domain-containing protein [Galbibacter pacificus]MDG3585825.1 DUF4251 domain-containing protein [Galbibacter pacificus]
MKSLSFLCTLVIGSVIIGCGSSQNTAISSAEMAAVDTLIHQKKFRVENQWAMPTMSSSMMQIANSGLMPPGNSAQRINLAGNANYLEVKGDSVKAYLPFFGERQMGGGYNDDEAIKFNQEVKDMDIEYIENKKHYRIKFSANNNTESFNVTLMVYNNEKTTLTVNSSKRDMIGYQGTIMPLPDKK